MSISEITLEELNAEEFIDKQVAALSSAVGDEIAINALSGGVDSSVVTLLGHRAFGDRLKTYFIDNGLMREEPQQIAQWFADLGVKVEIVDAQGDSSPGFRA
jgi:GMP synthase (glutamine-hydrolysing)